MGTVIGDFTSHTTNTNVYGVESNQPWHKWPTRTREDGSKELRATFQERTTLRGLLHTRDHG